MVKAFPCFHKYMRCTICTPTSTGPADYQIHLQVLHVSPQRFPQGIVSLSKVLSPSSDLLPVAPARVLHQELYRLLNELCLILVAGYLLQDLLREYIEGGNWLLREGYITFIVHLESWDNLLKSWEISFLRVNLIKEYMQSKTKAAEIRMQHLGGKFENCTPMYCTIPDTVIML